MKGYETERDVRMAPGQTVTEGGYEFKFVKIGDATGPNYAAIEGSFEISKNGNVVALMKPEKRRYFASGQTMTEASIDAGFTRDVYVALGEPVEGATDGAWGVRIYVKPFINWIWGGCILMALGGLLAILDRRYRLKLKVRQPEILASPPPAPMKPKRAKSARPQTGPRAAQ